MCAAARSRAAWITDRIFMTVSRRHVVCEVLTADDDCMSSIRRRRKTGVHRLGRRHEADQVVPESRVDPAALGLAAVAAGVSVLSADGDWDLVDTVLGLVLLPVVVAYHQLPFNAGLWRRRLMKLAFSGVAAQLLILVIGWPVQELFVERQQMTRCELLQWVTSTDRSYDDPPLRAADDPLSLIDDRPLAPDDATTALLGMAWPILSAAIYFSDPWLMRTLDGDSARPAARQRRPSSPYAGVSQPSVRRETSS